jgi:predicted PurR-regulated permease PerM
MTFPVRQDLTRTVLAVLFLAALIAASFWVLRPFLGAAIWATMIVVATWPLMLGVQARLWNRRSLAVVAMTLGLLLVLVVPLTLAIGALVENAEGLVDWAQSLSSTKLPPAPDWLGRMPFVGPKAVEAWNRVVAEGVTDLSDKIAPYAGKLTQWLASKVGSVGLVILQFLLTVVIAAIMYAGGESAASGLVRFGRRLAGDRGENAIRLAGRAIRGVALGVVVTALVQSLLGGIGLAVTGVPFAALLTGVMFLLCIAQFGPLLVLAPAVIWLYWREDWLWGTVLLVVSLVAVTMDNVLRPILIRKGADLPLLLVFAGVIGGLISFGLVGIFVGPVVLAVTYTLLDSWVREAEPGAAPPPGPAGDAAPPAG